MEAYGKSKENNERMSKRTESVKTLVGFMKNISKDWDIEEELDKFRTLSD